MIQFLNEQQIEEMAEFGYIELSEQLMQQMAEYYEVDISKEDD